MGVVGLETAFPVLYTELVLRGMIELDKLIALMAVNPRRVFRLPPMDGLEAGQAADLAVLDLERRYTIEPESFLSKGRASPFAGWTVQGATRMTMIDGRIVYESI